MKKYLLMIAAGLCLILAGCGQPAPSQGGEAVQDPSGAVSTPPAEAPAEPPSPAKGPAEPTAPAVGQVAMVYIGTKDDGFTDYPNPKTLQMGFTGEGGDPDALDIWYYMEGNQPLELPALGLSWPIDQPYQWTARISEEPPAT